MNTDLKARFLRVFSSLPLGVRREIILVLDPQEGATTGGPITWEVAYIEVENDTPISNVIMQKLAKLDFI